MCNFSKILIFIIILIIASQAQEQQKTAPDKINHTFVDEIQGAYSAALGSINPLAYDPWADVVLIVHQGSASYGTGSGQLWYNISKNKGTSWTRVNVPINSNPANGRYPSITFLNPFHQSFVSSIPFFSWAELTPDHFGNVGYGFDLNIGLGLLTSDTIKGTPGYGMNIPCWTIDNDYGAFWTADNQENSGITLFRSLDLENVDIINPPQWSSAAFQNIGNIPLGGASNNGIQYYAVLGTFPDPDSSNPIKSGWYPALTKSTDKGITWSEWDVIDFRTIPVLSSYDRLWDWNKNDDTVSYQGDMIVDNNGFVHIIIGVTDTTSDGNSGNNAIVELYQTTSGWEGKIIAQMAYNSDLTDWSYGSLNQNGYSAYLSKSRDSNILAAQWGSGSPQSNLVDVFYSFRETGGEWRQPVNITNTPLRTESISHMASYLAHNYDSSYTLFSMFLYDKEGNIPPDETVLTNIYVTPVRFSTDTLSTLKLLSPNGGENWIAGSLKSISWVSTYVSNIRIEYSTDSGITWKIITDSVVSNGNHSWILPNVISNNCRVKITNISDTTLFDISDNDFKISNGLIDLVGPTGGEYFTPGGSEKVSWTAGVNTINIKIEYTIDNGETWSFINSVPNTGTYYWLVPNTLSDECKIRISDANTPSIHDISDSTFSIVNIGAVIQADSLWIDSDFNGVEYGLVDGSASYITSGSLKYHWYVNYVFAAEGVSPQIPLHTGTNYVQLVVSAPTNISASAEMIINVYSSKLSTGMNITGGISQLNEFVYVSGDKGIYIIDSSGTVHKSLIKNNGFKLEPVIHKTTNALFTASEDTIYCFDSELNTRWNLPAGGSIAALSTNYNGDVVYALVNTGTITSYLKSFSAADGSLRWSYTTGSGFYSAPAVIEILDLDSVLRKTYIYYRTGDGVVTAIDDRGSTAEVYWTKSLESGVLRSSPAVSNEGMVYFASGGNSINRIRWDGEYNTEWKKSALDRIIYPILIDDAGIVYAVSERGCIGLEKEFTYNSFYIKMAALMSNFSSVPGLGPDGTILLGYEDGLFYSFDRKSDDVEMEIKWRFRVPGGINKSSMISENGTLYLSTLDGDIFIMQDIPSEKQVSEWPASQGNNQRSKVVRLVKNISEVEDKQEKVIDYALFQNYPNPFNPYTKIKYQVPSPQIVTIRVYDVLGNHVITLVNEEQNTGTYEVDFNGRLYSSGVYFCKMTSGNYTETIKISLMK